MKVPIILVFALIPIWVLYFVFGAVFGGIWVEDKTGMPGLAFLWTVFWWGSMLGGTAWFFKNTELY